MSYIEIKTTNGHLIQIDQADFELVSRYRWSAVKKCRSRTLYAMTHGENGKPIALHRLILKPGDGVEVDHKDGNGLNNRRDNLRTCTRRQNCLNKRKARNNKTGFRGVHFCAARGYRAMIGNHGKVEHIGYFPTAEQAAGAYRERAKILHGDFNSA